MKVAAVLLVEPDGSLYPIVTKGCTLSQAFDVVLMWRRVIDPCARFVLRFG